MRRRHAAGLIAWCAVFVLLSYLPYFAPRRALGFFALMVFWTYWCSTAIILCDEGRRWLEGRSLLDSITAGRGAFFRFVATGAASGVLLDGCAQWVGKLWIYPYWNTAVYGGTFVLGFCAYWLLLAETYYFAKAVLIRLAPAPVKREAKAGNRRVPAFLGGALAAAGLLLAIHDYRAGGGYRFEIRRRVAVHVHFACFLLLFAGAWLLLEAVEQRQSKTSLLGALRSGNWRPLAAVLGAGWLFGLLMETTNAGQHFWVYTNWPLQRTAICGVPVAVLIAWPLQYVIFLSVFHIAGGDAARDVWG